MNAIQDLEQALTRAPEDWSIRIRLIEARVLSGDMDGARRLVRESPDESPLPPELQYRVHTLMTQGAAALIPTEEDTPTAPPTPSRATAPPMIEDPAEKVPTREPVSPVPERKEPHHPAPPKLSPNATSPAKPYDGDLRIEAVERPSRRHRVESAAQKLSALSLALLAHLALALLIGFVVIAVPRPNPPLMIATVTTTERGQAPIPPRPPRATERLPGAASAAPPNVIGAAAVSPVSVPEPRPSHAVDVTTMTVGNAAIGDGFSFEGDAREVSDVNFFGISAGGKRIVFIIDATREMLVDEKGGMYAYDKVKNEIGSMMAGLNRGTKFNLLLYEGRRLMAYADQPVEATPSNLRLAIEWLHPLNRDYDELGLAGHRGEAIEVDADLPPIAARDLAHYTKAIQKALEWQAESIFCIAGGYVGMTRSPTPEEMEAYRKQAEANPGTPGEVSAAERDAWAEAQRRTREWLAGENAARAGKGLPPKVVTNFNQLVREITGATPPRATGGSAGARPPRPEPHSPDDIETLVRHGVTSHYKEVGMEPPALHMVVFLGEDEDMDDQTREHFQNLTRKNRGKFKMLRGLAALENVTGK